MGKLGARGPDFSSDIDLIVFFDTEAEAIIDPYEAGEIFARLTRRLLRILQDRTEHGYVFRTDLRGLRRSRLDAAGDPGAGGTPLLRKSRPELGARGDDQGAPDRWRHSGRRGVPEGITFLCLAQISGLCGDRRRVHSIKRQIPCPGDMARLPVLGHNVKLGRGGIREIEFSCRRSSLSLADASPNCAAARPVAMLGELAARNWITPEASEVLSRQYWFLRRVEHVLQIADEQTHAAGR